MTCAVGCLCRSNASSGWLLMGNIYPSRFMVRGRKTSTQGRGTTLIEMLVVLTIVALILGGVIVSFGVLSRTTAKSTAARMAAAMRYTYDRAVTTGAYYRLVIDLTRPGYWIERSDERFYLVDREKSPGRGKALDEEEEKKNLEEKEKRSLQPQTSSLATNLLPPPLPRRAMFKETKDSITTKVELKNTFVRDFYTARQSEPYTSGKAYLYFFPDGHTERALLHLEDKSGDVYSIIVHSLTGRVEIIAGDVPLKQIDLTLDEEGSPEAPR